MLIKLLPDQVARYWSFIRPAIEGALPPTASGASDRMQNILTGVLTGDIVVWANVVDRDGAQVMNGVVSTMVQLEIGTGDKSLLFYTMFGYQNSLQRDWIDGIATLSKYAISEGCSRIVAYTNVPGMVSMAERLGADTSFRFISFPL